MFSAEHMNLIAINPFQFWGRRRKVATLVLNRM